MSLTASNQTGNVGIRLTAYHNCDDVELFWRVTVNGKEDTEIPGVLGFMIERQRQQQGGAWGPSEILRNAVGFPAQPAASAGDRMGMRNQPSNLWPFQCYDWTDHGANSGQVVRYRVSAMRLPPGGTAGQTQLTPTADSGWTAAIAVEADDGGTTSAFFNRGTVMSQYVARVMRQNGWKAADIKEHVKDIEEPLRRFLSGELRLALLRLLDDILDDSNLELYAALYELADDEIIDRLKRMRGRAHIILSNGSNKKGDENQQARRDLKNAKVDVHNRLLASKGLGHNKFAVVAKRQNRKALRVWTGSTNWTLSGLCTQLNNGILFDDSETAGLYLDQWDRLAEAGSDFTRELVADNAESPRPAGKVDVWFTRVRNKSKKNEDLGADLQALDTLVNRPENRVILYVMFQPGPDPLTDILKRGDDCYVRGVVSTVIASNKERFQLSGLTDKVYKTQLVQPEGIVKDFSAWVEEVTRRLFITTPKNPGIGHAITHAKIIVINPLDDDCVVVTGSHNFSGSASEQNDENFVVVHHDRELAEAYAVACLSIYRHYRWRAFVKDLFDQGKRPWDHLSPSPSWQSKYLTPARKQHLAIWCP
jgi:phosphatidylserine/phosphatidylglycerophosphate/cardiolipin synthase-like enzyme